MNNQKIVLLNVDNGKPTSQNATWGKWLMKNHPTKYRILSGKSVRVAHLKEGKEKYYPENEGKAMQLQHPDKYLVLTPAGVDEAKIETVVTEVAPTPAPVPVVETPIIEEPIIENVQLPNQPEQVVAKFNASPAALKYAVENNIDLSEVQGTGKDGKITMNDVKV